jgi:hypothetical protein
MNDNYQFCREDPDAAAFKLTELERENAKLRELAKMVVLYASGEALPTTEEILARALDLSAQPAIGGK